MLFPEEDASMLKAWIIKRLENTSDADADVLAEYVLALLRHEGTIEEVRALCEAEIPDFLKEDTSVFVNDVFEAIKYRSYLPGGALPRPGSAAVPPQGLPYDDLSASLEAPAQNGSRKRSYHDRGDVQMQDAADYYSNNGRSYKQPRRGRGGRMDDANGFRRGLATGGFQAASAYQVPPTYGTSTPGAQQQPFDPNTFDPNNPLEAMMRLQAMGVPLPPLPPFPQPGQQQLSGAPPRRRQRCRDYDTKGYCARGNSCMFEHGTDSIYVPPAMPLAQSPGQEEYDPTSAGMLMPQMRLPTPTQSNQPFNTGPNFQRPQQHNGKPKFGRKGPRRAAFSADGPVLDRTKSTIVVENIPEEHFSEDEIRAFFSQYGTIVEVSMRPYKHLAIVKYDSWNAANAAYRSPKVIFDNRFVKVFWYKDADEEPTSTKNGDGAAAASAPAVREGSAPASATAEQATPEIDMEDFLRRQEEAQRAFEEKRQKAAEIERQREELERKQKELLAKQQAERQRLYARIAALSAAKEEGAPPSSSPPADDAAGGGGGGGGGTDKKPSQSEALRAQLAALEAEAKQLGIDPDAGAEEEQPWSGFSYRGAYRGRGRGGGFAPRGRGGYPPRAGGYRGRGGGVGRGGGHAAYAAYSIDNRPKKVAVSGVDFTDEDKGEMLRQYLFGIGEFTDISETPSATTIAFKDRKTAEKFFYGLPNNKQIPGIEGQLELSWVTDAASGAPFSTTAGGSPTANGGGAGEEQKKTAAGEAQKDQAPSGVRDDKEDVAMQEQQQQQQPEEQDHAVMDYDVAGEEQWDIG